MPFFLFKRVAEGAKVSLRPGRARCKVNIVDINQQLSEPRRQQKNQHSAP